MPDFSEVLIRKSREQFNHRAFVGFIFIFIFVYGITEFGSVTAEHVLSVSDVPRVVCWFNPEIVASFDHFGSVLGRASCSDSHSAS